MEKAIIAFLLPVHKACFLGINILLINDRQEREERKNNYDIKEFFM